MNIATLSALKDSLITYVPNAEVLKILMEDEDAAFILQEELGVAIDIVRGQLDFGEKFDGKTFPWLHALVSYALPAEIPELLEEKRKKHIVQGLQAHKESCKCGLSTRLRVDATPWAAYVAAVKENTNLQDTAKNISVTPIVGRSQLLESLSVELQKNIKAGDLSLQRSTEFLQMTADLLHGREATTGIGAMPAYMWEDSFWGDVEVEHTVSYLQTWSSMLKNPTMRNKIIVHAGLAQSKVGDAFVAQANPDSKLRQVIDDLNFSASRSVELGEVSAHLNLMEFAIQQVTKIRGPLPQGVGAHFLGKHFPVLLGMALVEQDKVVISKLVNMGIISVPWDADGSTKMNPARLLTSLVGNWELVHWLENYSTGILHKPELACVMHGNKKFIKRAAQAGAYQTALEAMKGLLEGEKVALEAQPLQGMLNFLNQNSSKLNQGLIEEHSTLSYTSIEAGKASQMAAADERFAAIMASSPEHYLNKAAADAQKSPMGEAMLLLQGTKAQPYKDKSSAFWGIVRDLLLGSYDMKVPEILSVADSALQ